MNANAIIAQGLADIGFATGVGKSGRVAKTAGLAQIVAAQRSERFGPATDEYRRGLALGKPPTDAALVAIKDRSPWFIPQMLFAPIGADAKYTNGRGKVVADSGRRAVHPLAHTGLISADFDDKKREFTDEQVAEYRAAAAAWACTAYIADSISGNFKFNIRIDAAAQERLTQAINADRAAGVARVGQAMQTRVWKYATDWAMREIGLPLSGGDPSVKNGNRVFYLAQDMRAMFNPDAEPLLIPARVLDGDDSPKSADAGGGARDADADLADAYRYLPRHEGDQNAWLGVMFNLYAVGVDWARRWCEEAHSAGQTRGGNPSRWRYESETTGLDMDRGKALNTLFKAARANGWTGGERRGGARAGSGRKSADMRIAAMQASGIPEHYAPIATDWLDARRIRMYCAGDLAAFQTEQRDIAYAVDGGGRWLNLELAQNNGVVANLIKRSRRLALADMRGKVSGEHAAEFERFAERGVGAQLTALVARVIHNDIDDARFDPLPTYRLDACNKRGRYMQVAGGVWDFQNDAFMPYKGNEDLVRSLLITTAWQPPPPDLAMLDKPRNALPRGARIAAIYLNDVIGADAARRTATAMLGVYQAALALVNKVSGAGKSSLGKLLQSAFCGGVKYKAPERKTDANRFNKISGDLGMYWLVFVDEAGQSLLEALFQSAGAPVVQLERKGEQAVDLPRVGTEMLASGKDLKLNNWREQGVPNRLPAIAVMLDELNGVDTPGLVARFNELGYADAAAVLNGAGAGPSSSDAQAYCRAFMFKLAGELWRAYQDADAAERSTRLPAFTARMRKMRADSVDPDAAAVQDAYCVIDANDKKRRGEWTATDDVAKLLTAAGFDLGDTPLEINKAAGKVIRAAYPQTEGDGRVISLRLTTSDGRKMCWNITPSDAPPPGDGDGGDITDAEADALTAKAAPDAARNDAAQGALAEPPPPQAYAPPVPDASAPSGGYCGYPDPLSGAACLMPAGECVAHGPPPAPSEGACGFPNPVTGKHCATPTDGGLCAAHAAAIA